MFTIREEGHCAVSYKFMTEWLVVEGRVHALAETHFFGEKYYRRQIMLFPVFFIFQVYSDELI